MIPVNHLLTILTTYKQNMRIHYLPNDLLSITFLLGTYLVFLVLVIIVRYDHFVVLYHLLFFAYCNLCRRVFFIAPYYLHFCCEEYAM